MPILKRTPDIKNKGKMGEKKNSGPMQHVGLVLRARRREMNMSQASLAEKMQTSQEVISNYENGVTPVRADDLTRFASILAVTPIYFFEPNPQNIAAAPQFQPGDTQPGGVQPAGVDISADSWQHSPKGVQPADVQFSEASQHDSRAAGKSAVSELKSDLSPKSAPAPRWTDARAEAEAHNALPLGALSEEDLEKALLAHYHALGSRRRTLAVKLIRELAQDERETKSQVVVWKAKP